MGTLTSAIEKITAELKAKLPEGIDVEQHPGRFTDEELSKTVRKKRAVRIALENLPALEVSGDGLRSAEALFFAHVICADVRGGDRHTEALNLVEEIVQILAYQRWDQPETFGAIKPSDIDASNLYSIDISTGKGIAWWAISWKQTIRSKPRK